MNRLNLDFSLNTYEERKLYIDEYLQRIHYTPSEDELEMMGNYILWGKDSNGESLVDTGELEIETRHKTWNKKDDESLDALLEQPTFNEAATFVSVPTKIPRQVFPRQEALEEAPEHLKPVLEELFMQIDELDLLLNYYDLLHGKRKKPPREELLTTFGYNKCHELQEKATHLNQYKYLKLRHELVELRREQFTIKDSYNQPLQRALPQFTIPTEELEFEYNLTVYPLGIAIPNTFTTLIFQPEEQLIPQNFTDKQLKIISKYIWDKKDQRVKQNQNCVSNPYIDLCDPEHLAQLFLYFEDLQEQEYNQTTLAMLDTLKYYIRFAQLTDLQLEILNLKIQKQTNQQIQNYINDKYNKSYTINYISTIFRQKIIPSIIEGIKYHQDIIENLFFEEEFKTCIKCGHTLLIHPHNFVRKARSRDGFNNKCKNCEKIERAIRLEE